jgi:hypothetical protein
MKKSNSIFLTILAFGLLALSSCEKKTEYPETPVDGQTYVDNHGNSSVWNAALNYWMINSMLNGQRTTVYYYPTSGVYKNTTGTVITRPTSIPPARSHSSMRSRGFGSTGHSSSAS